MISDAKSTDQKSNGTKPVQAKEGPGAEELEDGKGDVEGTRKGGKEISRRTRS
jgi:hypothetical protein